VAAIPFSTYIVKIASVCNLNCTYCFVYNKADARWRRQPKQMSVAVMRKTAARIVEHCKSNGKDAVELIFHGGEPLIGGLKHLEGLVGAIESEFAESGVNYRLNMQSNGLLFTEALGELFLGKKISVGISIDGPPHVNDRSRVDHAGRGSSVRLEDKLRLLTSERFRPVFGGFLIVVNPEYDPVEIIDYLMQFRPGSFDFLLPYDNHDTMPPLKASFESEVYGDWLIRAFDHWYLNNLNVRIRNFHSIIKMLLGGRSAVESLGAGIVDFIVIETNGEIEAVDSLKASYEGATKLALDVFTSSFDDAAGHVKVLARQSGVNGLCDRCQRCAIAKICGGGYLPNRYSQTNGFDNPSVFCNDLSKLIYHIHDRVAHSLQRYNNSLDNFRGS
jgi:uncharacterized protein